MSTDYSKMSDFEINKRVALASGKNIKFISVDVDDNEIGVIVGQKHTRQQLPFDPCNNPAEAWPIIIENGISIVRLDKNWLCAPIDEAIDGITGDNEVCFYASEGVVDNNPLRSSMIVFLMMQEKRNGG